MDYRQLAQQFVDLQGALHRLPISRELPPLEGGLYFVLHYLAGHSGVHPRELSREMGVSTARTAVLLRQLEERGMLQRQADATDSRQTLVTITPAGLQAAQEKWEQVVHAVAALLEQLGPEDAQALLRIQGRLLQIAACGSLRSCPHG